MPTARTSRPSTSPTPPRCRTTWLVFANVFDPAGSYLYGYGVFGAPNGGPGFSGIATGDGGPSQGAQYLNAYSDYNNGDHASGNTINALIFQEREINPVDVGKSFSFEFDYLKTPVVTNGDGATTTNAFIKILRRSDFSFATIQLETLDTTSASTTNWASGRLDITIDPTWVGELMQFGYESFATNYDDSGRFYDNIDERGLLARQQLLRVERQLKGSSAVMSATGSNVAANNDITLQASGSRPTSSASSSSPRARTRSRSATASASSARSAATSDGQICSTGTTGAFELQIDLQAIPQGGGTAGTSAGQT